MRTFFMYAFVFLSPIVAAELCSYVMLTVSITEAAVLGVVYGALGVGLLAVLQYGDDE